jgi:ribosome-interacting GTPase 1
MVLCHDLSAPVGPLLEVRAEIDAAGIRMPSAVVATKADDAGPGSLAALRGALPDLEVVTASILDEASLDGVRHLVWSLTGLIRVFTRRHGDRDADPMALPAGAVIRDVAAALHGDLAGAVRGARVWGSSAGFEGQRVGPEHRVQDGDVIELLV